MDKETSFWENHEVQNTAFQEANLLNIVNHYVNSSYNKTVFYISILGGKAYIQELITTVYPQHCHEVLRMNLYVFLDLASWLEKNIALKKF